MHSNLLCNLIIDKVVKKHDKYFLALDLPILKNWEP